MMKSSLLPPVGVPAPPPLQQSGPAPATGRRATVTTPAASLFSRAKRTDRGVPLRVFFYSEAGFGKTSAAACAPGVAFVLTPGEDGYHILLSRGLVPEVDVAQVSSWSGLCDLLDALAGADQDQVPTWLAIDAMTGVQELLFEHLVQTEYNGVRGEKGFLSYQSGYKIAGREMDILKARLDRVRDRGVNILLLAHSTIGRRPNPEGKDFPRFVPQLHERVWEPLEKWHDVIVIGRFDVDPKEIAKGVVRGQGGGTRILSTQQADWLTAKSRLGNRSEIIVPEGNGQTTWQALELFWKE